MRNQRKIATPESSLALENGYQRFKWECSDVVNLPIPEEYKAFTIDHIPFGGSEKKRFRTVTQEALGALLWLTSRQQFSEKHTMRYYQRLRPCFEESSVYPIHMLIWNQREQVLRRYNPFNHTLEAVRRLSPKPLRSVYRAVDIQEGELIMFVAEPGKTASFITGGDNQVWRDTHVIQGYLSLAAEMLSLNFTSIAMTGQTLINQLDSYGRLHGVGINVVGSK